MKTFTKQYSSDLINTKGHWMVGTIWSAAGSKGNIYSITMKDNGFECNCPAFKRCKHIDAIETIIVEA